MDAEIFFNKRWIEHNKKESDPDMHLSLSAEELELIETTIVDFSNLRIIEVLEGLFPSLVDDKYTNPFSFQDAEKIYKELKSQPIVIEPDDLPPSVGGGYGFKDILGC